MKKELKELEVKDEEVLTLEKEDKLKGLVRIPKTLSKKENAYTRRRAYTPRRSQLKSVETVEGESIERKVRRIVANGEPINDGAPEIFTERSEGVISAYNVRTDRWELATEAMDIVAKSHIASREGKGKVIDLNEGKSNDGKAESTQGKEV